MCKKKSTKLEFFRRNNKSTIVLILEVAMQEAEAQIQETEEKSCCKRLHDQKYTQRQNHNTHGLHCKLAGKKPYFRTARGK